MKAAKRRWRRPGHLKEESLYRKPCRYRRGLRQPRPMASPFDTGARRSAWPIFQARGHQIEPKTASTGIQESQSKQRDPRSEATASVNTGVELPVGTCSGPAPDASDANPQRIRSEWNT